MKIVKIEDAIGKRLAHDYTCIEPGFKGAIKKRGDVVEEKDIESLKRCGHFYVYIEDDVNNVQNTLHEVEAVTLLGQIIAGENIEIKTVEEGKAFLYASTNGLVIVDSERLRIINSTGTFVVISRKTGNYVTKGSLIAVIDLIPLNIQREYINKLIKEIEERPLIRVVQSKNPRVAILITGTEIAEGLKKDLAAPIIVKKLKQYNCTPGIVKYARDDLNEIINRLFELLYEHDAIIVTGGMSVDPTDLTHIAIKLIADEIIAYGVPIKPTTMSMIAYKENKPIIGVSSGIIHYPRENILDIVLPWISSGVKISREFIVSLGEGGLMRSFLERLK